MPDERLPYPEIFISPIVEEFDGRYSRDFSGVQKSVYYSGELLRSYLGTYYPRSLLETYDISNEFFRKVFGPAVQTDGELRILDAGCGMGGASIGLLFAVLERFSVKKVVIEGFDANAESLRFLENILQSESFENIWGAIDLSAAPGSGEAWVDPVLRETAITAQRFDVVPPEAKYDIILTSKMLNEVSVSEKYYPFLEAYLPHLTENGICIVIDVNDKRDGRHFSQQLTEESLAFLADHPEFASFLPPGCNDCPEKNRPCGDFTQIVCEETDFDRLDENAEPGPSKVCCRIFCREPLYRALKGRLARFDFRVSQVGERNVFCPRINS